MIKRRKICVFVGSRANYGSLKAALTNISNHNGLELVLIAAASSLLAKDGCVRDQMVKDGFEISDEIYMLLDGGTPLTMAKSTGLGIIEASTILSKHNPDFTLVVGDRFEVMSFVIASAYMNIPIAHTMGGEITGTIDESIRHAITKFSHLHFAASEEAKNRLIALGERPEFVFNVGCPRIDIAREVLFEDKYELPKFIDLGVGAEINVDENFLLVSQHPVTTEFDSSAAQIDETLKAVEELDIPAIWLWPNADAGSSDISKQIRISRELGLASKVRFVKNFDIETYMLLMKRTSCLVGNSSSGIREGAFIGTPTVNIGTRQNGRERGPNVIDATNDSDNIVRAVKQQIEHGAYDSCSIYGDGFSGMRVAEILSTTPMPNVQKVNTF